MDTRRGTLHGSCKEFWLLVKVPCAQSSSRLYSNCIRRKANQVLICLHPVKHIVHRLFDIAGELHFCSHLIRYSTRHDGDNSQTQVVEFVNNDTKHMWYEHVNLKYELNEKKKRKMGVKKLNQLYAAANVVDYVNFRRREFEVDLEGLRKSVERLELERIPVYPVNNVKESEESGSSEDAPGEANPDIPC